MPALPLAVHHDLAAPIAWRQGQPLSVAQLLGDAQALAERLPAGAHLVNACTDRYRFAVGLCAALLSGKLSLLPSTYTPEVLRRLRDFAADAFVLTDGDPAGLPLPACAYPGFNAAPATCMPLIPADQRVAWVFTSGSTGEPVPHAKHWGPLVTNGRAEAALLGVADGSILLGTVPPQHMYGFESTVLQALMGGGAFDAGRPFYPADIAAALARLPAPAWLVTTPFHLRALLAEDLALPPLAGILSATAPLPRDLAAQAEGRYGVALHEIYGATETGQIALRRPMDGDAWRPFPGLRLENRADGRAWARGGHVEGEVALGDLLELLPDGRFHLLGRGADLVNIAGKRSSLAWLNQQLLAIDGVVDGVFHLPDEDGAASAEVVRPVAFVVAPGKTRDDILAALRQRLDPVFLPRPLFLLDALPRNLTGKLPRAACQALLGELLAAGRGAD